MSAGNSHDEHSAAINDERKAVVSDEPYGDGLVFVVKDDLQAEIWLDREWLGDIGLSKIDNFVRLRKYLYEVDDVAVLTELEAHEVRELIRESANA